MTTDDLALTDGHWAPNRHGIQVWRWDSREVAEVCAVDVGEQYELDLGVAS